MITKIRDTTSPATLLETGFPARRLQRLALVEGNSKRPIYQIHKWWARRLGSVFRALILSSALPSTSTEREFWERYYNGLSLRNLTLYDPMMGGGTCIVEGLRLGCRVIGADVNPVAWFTTKKEVEPFDEEAVDGYYGELERSAGERSKAFYRTRCPKGHDAEIVYALWIRQIACAKCGKVSDLFHSYIIREKTVRGKKGSKTLRTLSCQNCGSIFETTRDSAICPKCHHSFGFLGPAQRGVFQCPACKTNEKIVDAARRKGSPLECRMFAVQYSCPTCGIGFKVPERADEDSYASAVKDFEKTKRSLRFPRQRIAVRGRSNRRPVSHGFHHYYELFNPRQLLSLSLLLREINEIPDQSSREFLLLAFSSSLETNNVLCKYESKWGKTSALFGVPGYHVPNRYAENSLWGKGRGSFVRSYQKLKRGMRFAMRPYEVLFEGSNLSEETKSQKMYLKENIATSISISEEGPMNPEERARILCRDSRKMTFLPSESVDIVLTDPPYYDNLVYSELADFFYVWMRLGLKEHYIVFKKESSRRSQEIVVNEKSKQGEKKFVANLSQVFKESRRVLKNDGLIVFTFHHSNPSAWISLQHAIAGAGLHVTASPIIRSEGKSGYRRGNINYDACVVCRKEVGPKAVPNFSATNAYFEEECVDVVKELYERDPAINDSDILTGAMGVYLRANGSISDGIVNKPSELISKIRSRLPAKKEDSQSRIAQETLPEFGFA